MDTIRYRWLLPPELARTFPADWAALTSVCGSHQGTLHSLGNGAFVAVVPELTKAQKARWAKIAEHPLRTRYKPYRHRKPLRVAETYRTRLPQPLIAL